MAQPREFRGGAVRYSKRRTPGRTPHLEYPVLRPYSAVLSASFRRSGRALAGTLVQCWPLFVLLACGAIVGATSHWGLRLNTSRSAPRGLYRMLTTAPSRGALVAVCLPPEVARFGRARGYLGPGDCPGGIQAAIKRVIALPGDIVDVTPVEVRVNDRPLPDSATVAVDSAGRPLPHVPWGRHPVPAEQVWLLGTGDPRGWDSRYFGPLRLAQIRATVAPVLTLD